MAGSTLGHEQFTAGIHRHIRMYVFSIMGAAVAGALVFTGAVRLVTTPAQRHAGMQSYSISFSLVNKRTKAIRLARLQPALGRWQHAVSRSAPLGLGGAVGAFLLIIRLFGSLGEKAKDEKYKRGAKLVTPEQLSSLNQKEAKDRKSPCQFSIGSVWMLPGFEQTHMFIGGTTKTGKSTLMRGMFGQIREAGQKALIYDPGGHYLSQFAQEGDWLLNPFDLRADAWNIFDEIRRKPDCRAIATSLIPEPKNGDPFWAKNARTVMADLLWQIKTGPGQATNAVLFSWLKSHTEDLAEYLAGSMAESVLTGANAKRADDIHKSMLTDLHGLEYLGDSETGGFSIRNWVEHGAGWLFITSRGDILEEIGPFIALWLELVGIQLLSMSETKDTRVWVAVDELADLHKLEALPKLLAQGRKYGGAVMVATQNFPQLREIYGKEGSASMLDLLNTKIFLRIKDPEAQKYASDSLGEREYDTLKKSDTVARSQGPSTGLSDDTKRDSVVLASEFGSLPTGTCYLDPAEHFPPCRLVIPDFPSTHNIPCFDEEEADA